MAVIMITMHECTICGERKFAGQVWFLVVESPWEDKLTVLQWRDDAAHQDGFYPACGAVHVQELVVHWMATGSLDYPFAAVAGKTRRRRRHLGSILPPIQVPDLKGTKTIGELAVDRESVGRALRNDPDSLQVILDELFNLLQQETKGVAARFESADAMCYGFPRQI
jgi:hypothetical protein